MPPILLKGHQTLDRAVDAACGKTTFKTEAERVAFLFDLYSKYTSLLTQMPQGLIACPNSITNGRARSRSAALALKPERAACRIAKGSGPCIHREIAIPLGSERRHPVADPVGYENDDDGD